nr:c-type cytochrome domain-containing protein [Robiginitalea sp. SC105]
MGLSVFLGFCLLFESYLVVPEWVVWIGRWHPVLVHFPIVLLLGVIFLGFTRRNFPVLLFEIAVVSALLTAITGFFLARDVVVKGSLLWWHQYLGAGVALGAAFWYGFRREMQQRTYLQWGIQVILLALILAAGHYGGMTTHGEDFLAFPGEKAKRELPENPLIYQDVVQVILDDHCVKCHNPSKQKGELLLTSLDGLRTGGENGPVIVPGDMERSEIIRRLHLPLADEAHMPPQGERPLDKSQIRMIERWVALGAPDTLRMNDLPIQEPLLGLLKELREPKREDKWAGLPKVADSTIENLGNDYTTIRRISGNSEALSVNIYLPPTYDSTTVTSLRALSGNIVELDLSGLPIGRTELEWVGNCPNMEWLEIDRTPVADSTFRPLANLLKLEVLKIYETGLGDASLPILMGMGGLRHVYLYGTQFSGRALDIFRQQRPEVTLHTGIDPENLPFPDHDAEGPIVGEKDSLAGQGSLARVPAGKKKEDL